MSALAEKLRANPYAGYAYGYPHKTAYRPLDPPRRLRELWREARDASDGPRFLYVHVPVCEMRCGFCNLFTTTGTDDAFEHAYLGALERQAARVHDAIGDATHGDARFTGAAIGGGTPTFFSTAGLARILRVMGDLGASPSSVPCGVETSPRTAEADKLAILREAGVRRISIGVQSFDEAETGALGRAQKLAWIEAALERIQEARFPIVNLDLMYGIEGQSIASFGRSIDRALGFRPEELYLYPVYVRPLTGLARAAGRATGPRATDLRLEMFRAGRDRLLAAGYEQISMRLFRRADVAEREAVTTTCQEEDTVGVGCGARSYTRRVHYSTEWAVGASDVRSILRAYVEAPDEAFDVASHGAELDGDEERRRYVLKTLLRREGVPLDAYAAWFGSDALVDLPELVELVEAGLAVRTDGRLALTAEGLELSDAIGPLLYSAEARAKMAAFDLR